MQGAPFTRRIFVTNAGWRQTEPASLTAVATHHCLSELLMYIVSSLSAAQQLADSITGDTPYASELRVSQFCQLHKCVLVYVR